MSESCHDSFDLMHDIQRDLAKIAIGRLTGDDVPRLANAILALGLYSDSLAVFAAESQLSISAVLSRLEAGLKECGMQIPTIAAATKFLAQDIARQIVTHKVTPYKGARQIWTDLSRVPGAFGGLSVFVGLASEYEDASEELYRRDYEQMIIEEARKLLEDPTCERSQDARTAQKSDAD